MFLKLEDVSQSSQSDEYSMVRSVVDTWDREPQVTNIHLTEMTEKRPRVLKTSLIILSLFCIPNTLN
jgi:hypothetical protein